MPLRLNSDSTFSRTSSGPRPVPPAGTVTPVLFDHRYKDWLLRCTSGASAACGTGQWRRSALDRKSGDKRTGYTYGSVVDDAFIRTFVSLCLDYIMFVRRRPLLRRQVVTVAERTLETGVRHCALSESRRVRGALDCGRGSLW